MDTPHHSGSPDPGLKDRHPAHRASDEPAREKSVNPASDAFPCRIPERAHRPAREHFTSILVAPEGGELDESIARVMEVTTGAFELMLIAEGIHGRSVPVAASFQEAVEMAQGDVIALLRASAVPGRQWLERLRRALFCRPGYGIAVPLERFGAQRPRPGDVENAAEIVEFRRIPPREAVDSCIVMRREIAQAAAVTPANTCAETVQNIWIQCAVAGLQWVVAGDVVLPIGGSQRRRRSLETILAATGGPTRMALAPLRGRLRIRALIESGQFEAAVEAQRALIQRWPHDRSLLRELGWIMLRAGWTVQAKELLAERVADESDDPEWLQLEGFCAEALGDLDRAERCALRVLTRQPLSSRAACLRGVIATARGDAATAERSFRAAIVADPSRGHAYAHLGSLLWARGERQAALAELERAFLLTPEEAEIAATYTDAAAQLGQEARARLLVEEACGLHPGVRMLHQLHASFLLAEGRRQESLNVLLQIMARFGVDDDTLNAAVALRKDLEHAGSLRMPPMPRVSLCMIVKDEQAHLARCLWSALPVADEIIVVDTGSSDRSADVAAAFGCRILQCAWDGDFSAARNAGLAAARGAWILVLDADESLAVQDHSQLRELVTGNGATRQAYRLLTRNYVPTADVMGWHRNDGSYDEEAGSGWIPSLKVRLFPRDARIRFEGAVHELVEQSLGRAGYRVQDAAVVVHHYGKLDRHRTQRKGLVYRELGAAHLGAGEDDSPEDLRALAVQEEELGNFREALVYWRRYAELAPEDPRAFLGTGTSAIGAGEMAVAVDALERARRHLPDRPEPSVQLAVALMHVGRTQEALVRVREVAKEHPDYHHGRAVLALALFANGLQEEALELVRRLQESGVSLTAFFTGHGRRFLQFGPKELAVAVLQPLADAGMITPDQGAILVQAYRDQATLL